MCRSSVSSYIIKLSALIFVNEQDHLHRVTLHMITWGEENITGLYELPFLEEFSIVAPLGAAARLSNNRSQTHGCFIKSILVKYQKSLTNKGKRMEGLTTSRGFMTSIRTQARILP